MAIIQQFADLNRKAIVQVLEKRVKFKITEQFTTIHNYIDLDSMILRKGAISAQAGERVLIPMNMRDGSLICIGKGNPDWNYSTPSKYKLCGTIGHARTSLEEKAEALEKIAKLLPIKEDDLCSPQELAEAARQALKETKNVPSSSVFQLTRYNRSKVNDDYGGMDDYWQYEFYYESIYESSEVCATFEQAMDAIRFDNVDEDGITYPTDDYHQFWNEITRYWMKKESFMRQSRGLSAKA